MEGGDTMRTIWDMIPGWAYGVFFAVLWVVIIIENWGW
jgi:hypothetical protein